MKRKLAALITLIAFAVTMVPSMAFAADTKTATADASYFVTDGSNDDNDNVDLNETVQANFEINDNGDNATTEPLADVYVWATDENGVVTSALNAYTDEKGATEVAKGNIANTYKIDSVKDGDSIYLAFAREGTYTIHAGVDLTSAKDADVVDDLTALKADTEYNKIVVEKDAEDINAMTVTDPDFLTASNNGKVTEKADTTTVLSTLKSNGVKKATVEVKVTKGNGDAAKNEEVTLSTSSANLQLNKTEATTDRSGKIKFDVTASKAGTYKIYLDTDDFNGVIKVVASNMDPNTIETIKEPKNPIAQEDAANGKLLEDVRFQLKDANGAVIDADEKDIAELVSAMRDEKGGNEDYISVVSQPDGSDYEGEDFLLAPKDPDDDYFVLKNVSGKKLDEGKYTIKIALDNGASAEASFEVAKFDKAVKMEIRLDAQTVALGSKNNTVKNIKLIDANGVEKVADADDLTLGYNGYAVDDFRTGAKMNDGYNAKFLQYDVKDDEKYLGSTITLTAVNDAKDLVATAEVIVAEDGQSLSFDPTSGPAGDDNDVTVQVVDGKGKTVAPGAGSTLKAVVQSQSNPEAKVDVEVDDVDVNATASSDLAKKGEGTITVSSDKEGTAEIQVYVIGGDGKTYANTLEYTFGAAPSGKDLNVVMTIDSPETIVNNKIVTIDAAPYVNADYRTMVPIRALAEDFGATVDWNADTQTVTVKLDGNTVEMTIGSTTYKVNGTEKTMDTAPIIKDGRTYVPVRFVAEALGFKVTPTYNADGTTASVVFAR